MKLNQKRTILVGLAFLSISAFWQIYDNGIPILLANKFHLEAGVIGIIMSIDNILALLLLPLFGILSDKTATRFGKRMPFIILGTGFASFFMVLIPLGANINNFPLFVISLSITLLAMSSYRSPAVALMPDVTPKEHRSKANAIINLMGALGGIISLLVIKLLLQNNDDNYLKIFIAVAIIMVVSVLVLSIFINENKLAQEIAYEAEEKETKATGKLEKPVFKSLIFLLFSVAFWFIGYNAVTTAFSRYADHVFNMKDYSSPLLVATAASIVAFLPIGIISSKVGRKKMILSGILLLGTAWTIVGFITSYTGFINIILALVGIAWAMINVNSYPMVVEMSQSGDIGKYTGYYYTFSMSAQVFTPILSGYLIQYLGYRVLFPYAAIFTFLAFFTMQMVKHGDNKPQAKAGIEAFEDFD